MYQYEAGRKLSFYIKRYSLPGCFEKDKKCCLSSFESGQDSQKGFIFTFCAKEDK